MPTGKVKWFSAQKGFGFVIPDDPKEGESFIHHSNIKMDGYRTLDADQRVSYTLEKSVKGLEAKNITLI